MKNQKGKKNPNYKDGYTLMQHYCIDCGTEITCQAIRCKSCSHKGIKRPEQSKLMTGSANPQFGKKDKNASNFKHGETLKKHYCECDKEICYDTFINGSGLCRSCATKLQLQDPINHPMWEDGLSRLPYPIEFNHKLKESIRDRDNHECQLCHIKEKELDRKLDIHHIDYNKLNCEDINLITLCNPCNVKVNINRDYWFAYFKEIINQIYQLV
jgi:hypothetical protein